MATDIRLDSMHIENFKGIQELDISFSPEQTDIYGDNATGKTSVVDAYTWTLFGKDSENQTAFGIKPVNSAGDVARHGAVTSVTLALDVNGRTYEIKREYAEKWTRKRGSANPVFSGNETTYSIDGVPKKKTEFDRFIRGLLDEDTFRILTNPSQFASVMDWKKRRDVLMSMAGSITDEDVLAANPTELEPLRESLEKYSCSDLMKKLKSDRQRVNKRREELPVRIDEAIKSRSGIDPDAEDYQARLKAIRSDIQRTQADIANIHAGGHSAEFSELTARIGQLRVALEARAREQMAAYNAAMNEYDRLRRGHESSIRNLEAVMREREAEAASAIQKRDALRKSFVETRAETWTDDGICPTCGQPLPEDQIEEKRKAFNVRKSERLEKLSAEGAELNAKIAALDDDREALARQLEAEQDRLDALIRPYMPDATCADTPEIMALVARRDALDSGSENARSEYMAQLQKALLAMQDEEARYVKTLSMIESDKAADARIAKLQADERKLAGELERIDAMIYACEQFTRAQVELVESNINGMFRVAKWRLFREQINGGLEECCELTVNGVPWADLNSASRILAGVDVINTLSAFYGASVPVFLDNAESVVHPVDSDGQLIRLIVSEPDKALRIETKEAA